MYYFVILSTCKVPFCNIAACLLLRNVTSTASVFRRRHTHMLLEILAEERLIGEVKALCYLLDAALCVAQKHAQLHRNVCVNPLVGCTFGHVLYRFGEIFGRDAQLLAIPAHSTFGAEVVLDEQYELCKDFFGTRIMLAGARLYAVYHVAYFVNHSEEHRLHHLATEVVVGFVHLLLHAGQRMAYETGLVFGQTEYGVVACEEEECRQFVYALDGFVEEVVADDDANAAAVGRHGAVVGDASLVDDDKVACLHLMFYRVDKISCRAFGTQCQQQTLHASWFARQWHVGNLVNNENVVVNMAASAHAYGVFDCYVF